MIYFKHMIVLFLSAMVCSLLKMYQLTNKTFREVRQSLTSLSNGVNSVRQAPVPQVIIIELCCFVGEHIMYRFFISKHSWSRSWKYVSDVDQMQIYGTWTHHRPLSKKTQLHSWSVTQTAGKKEENKTIFCEVILYLLEKLQVMPIHVAERNVS